jgi:hypothetical protein
MAPFFENKIRSGKHDRGCSVLKIAGYAKKGQDSFSVRWHGLVSGYHPITERLFQEILYFHHAEKDEHAP